MVCYSTEPGDHMFVKSYKLLFFAKNKNKNISKKYKQKQIKYS